VDDQSSNVVESMNSRMNFVLCALAVCLGVINGDNDSETPKIWALLVAGSNTWANYRHQADLCHAYQILHAHGIPDENIVVMMYDDIANNKKNPTPGIIINHPYGDDVYHGVLKDYVGKDVTPNNFINILTGNKTAMAHIGSGRVIESGPNDHVFVNFVDHGSTGFLAFPKGELTVKQLNNTITQLYNEKRYGKLVFYVEACEAGSMFRNVLPNDINVFATTAADYDESSWSCYYDFRRKTALGDVYSVNWMEDSDAEDIETETLQKQYTIDENETTTSHVMEYGDLTIGKLAVGQFQGLQPAPPKLVPKVAYERGAPSWEVPLDILYRSLATASTNQEKEQLRREMDEMVEKRMYLETTMKKIVSRVAVSLEQQERLVSARPERLTKLDCHHNLVKAFSGHCFDFGMNSYALKYGYILANICEQGFSEEVAIRAMKQVCKSVTVKDAIE